MTNSTVRVAANMVSGPRRWRWWVGDVIQARSGRRTGLFRIYYTPVFHTGADPESSDSDRAPVDSRPDLRADRGDRAGAAPRRGLHGRPGRSRKNRIRASVQPMPRSGAWWRGRGGARGRLVRPHLGKARADARRSVLCLADDHAH